MSDRFHTLTVILEEDLRDDDAEPLMEAILQLRGVLSVKGVVANFDSSMAEDRARHKFLMKLVEAAKEPLEPNQ